MAGYRYVNNLDMTWREQREDVAVKVRQRAKRVLNEVLRDLDKEFQAEAAQGRVLRVQFTDEEIDDRIRRAVVLALGPGEVVDADS